MNNACTNPLSPVRTATKTDLERVAELRAVIAAIPREQDHAGEPTTRIGDKVMLSAVWDALSAFGSTPDDADLREWRRWLLRGMLTADASGCPLVVLARLDMASLVDRGAVERSEFSASGAIFDCVVDQELNPTAYGPLADCFQSKPVMP